MLRINMYTFAANISQKFRNHWYSTNVQQFVRANQFSLKGSQSNVTLNGSKSSHNKLSTPSRVLYFQDSSKRVDTDLNMVHWCTLMMKTKRFR